jgi:hypothetical protein
MRRRVDAFLANTAAANASDDVPVPLTAALWAQILRRPVTRDTLIGAILSDRSAAMVCYGLAGLDDETTQFVADHPGLAVRLVTRCTSQGGCSAGARFLRVARIAERGRRISARAAWEIVVGEKLDRPERFVQRLFEEDRGRLAYLLDVLAHADPAFTSLVFASPNGDALKRLAALVRRAFPEWEVATAPFARAPNDLGAFVARLRAATDTDSGAIDLGTSDFWQRVFDEPAGPASPTGVAWLAENVLGHPARERERRLDLFSFTQRVFGASHGSNDVVGAAHAYGAYPVLMLTLERMGVRTAPLYVAAAQHAEKLTALDATKGHVALSEFQGALALLDRATRARTFDVPTAEAVAGELFALRLEDGHYDGAIAAWLTRLADRVRTTTGLSASATVDDVILAAAAGPQIGAGAPRMEWEGQRYRVDPGAAELQRLQRTRTRQEGVSFATALGIRALVRRVTTSAPPVESIRDEARFLDAAAMELAVAERPDDEPAIRSLREAARTLASMRRAADLGDARRALGSLGAISEALLGHALLSLAYACDLGDPEGTILIAGDPSRRHDYGYDLPGRDARVKVMWGVASVETRRGPWHLVGSALALDVAMAPLALRRISVDRVPYAPILNLMHRDVFAAAVAVMKPAALTDADRDRIAEFVDRGQRVAAVVDGRENAAAISRDIDLDGWRTRRSTGPFHTTLRGRCRCSR